MQIKHTNSPRAIRDLTAATSQKWTRCICLVLCGAFYLHTYLNVKIVTTRHMYNPKHMLYLHLTVQAKGLRKGSNAVDTHGPSYHLFNKGLTQWPSGPKNLPLNASCRLSSMPLFECKINLSPSICRCEVIKWLYPGGV